MATGPSPPAQTVNSCRQSPALGVRGGEPGRSNQSQIERKKGWEKKGVAWMGLSFPLPFLRSPAPGQGACFPPPALLLLLLLLLSCKTGIGWDYLRKKKKKGEGEGIRAAARERAIESTFLQLPWVSFPHSLLFSNTKSPKLNPEQLFPSVQFPSLPLSHTRQEESPFFLLISLSHAQPLVSFKALEIPPSCPHSSMQTGIAMGALQIAGFSILFFLLHSGNTLANKASQGKRKSSQLEGLLFDVCIRQPDLLFRSGILYAGWRN